jgi:osmotically-inducible protein OsmY
MSYKGLVTAASMGVGAGLFYLFDADKGKRRRAVAQKRAARVLLSSERAIEKISREVGTRARGLVTEVAVARKKAVDNEVVAADALLNRVRSETWHAVSNPGAIRVTTTQGRVKLVGSVPKHELPQLLARVASVPGVTEMQNWLKVQPAKGRNWLKPIIWTVAGGALAACGSSLRLNR